MTTSTQLLLASAAVLIVFFILFFAFVAGMTTQQRLLFTSSKPGKLLNVAIAAPFAFVIVFATRPTILITIAAFVPIAAILLWIQIRSLRLQDFPTGLLRRYTAISAVGGVAIVLLASSLVVGVPT